MSATTTDSGCARAPFDHSKGDIILRSSDGINFRVIKLFLSLASPFFETLFSIPQPAEANGDQEVRDGLAVIPVTEDSKTLDSLLRFCYPCTFAGDPKIEGLKDAMDVLEAARKYSLDIIEEKARQAIVTPKMLEAEPLQCFAVACQGRLREETLLAAKYTLTQPLIPPLFREAELITLSDLFSLFAYHQKCGDDVYALRLNLSWVRSHPMVSKAWPWLSHGCYCDDDSDCECPRSGTRRFSSTVPPKWWEDFMEDTFTALRNKPCKETVRAFTERTVKLVEALDCPACSSTMAEIVREYSGLLVRKVEEVVSKVSCTPTMIRCKA